MRFGCRRPLDLRGCPKCGKSVRANVRRCPGCQTLLIGTLSVTFDWFDGSREVERVEIPIDLPGAIDVQGEPEPKE